MGEKNGRGKLISQALTYDGEWIMNVMQGAGTLKTPSYTLEGSFLNHKPHGFCRYFSDSYHYTGEYV